jgi:SAM-dependent methyltransferase
MPAIGRNLVSVVTALTRRLRQFLHRARPFSSTEVASASTRRAEPVFPRLAKVRPPAGVGHRYEPTKLSDHDRLRLLEAKVEHLLDENYRLKSLVRRLPEAIASLHDLRDYQASTFAFQWDRIPYHHEFLSNSEWRLKAHHDVAVRANVPVEWFRGKKVLDCGCGPGRHAWAFAGLGADVVAFDLTERTLDLARWATAEFPNVRVEAHSVLEPLPYPADFDLVWCYGVLHHTGNMIGGLSNIARHVKPGGRLYFMIYAEPRRDNIFDFQYRHEIATLRQETRAMSFDDKAEVFAQIEGVDHTLAWFDAISSEINETYTFEELEQHVRALGFVDVRRTMPHETMHNVTAVKS